MYTYHIMHNLVHFTGKSAQTDAKTTLTGARSNSTHIATTYIPQMPNFCPFPSMMSRFWVTSQFWMTPNYLEMFKIKSIHMHTTHTPQVFNMFHSMMSRYRVTPPFYTEWPQFSSVSLYEKLFLSYRVLSNFRKSALNDPNDLDMLKVKNTNMHVTYAPEAQIFDRFVLRWAVFELQPNFQKSALNDPKWPWHGQGEKYRYACYIHPRGPNFRPFCSMMSRFWVMAQLSEKCTEWPQMTLICSR